MAGVIGLATVSLGFLVLDLATGRGFGFTPAVLAGGLFHGLTQTCDVQRTAAAIAAYTALHLLVFLALGWFTAWLFSLTTRRPQLWSAALFLFVFVTVHLYGALLTILAPVSGCFSLYHVLGATAAAAAAMLIYLLWKHRGLTSVLARPENQ